MLIVMRIWYHGFPRTLKNSWTKLVNCSFSQWTECTAAHFTKVAISFAVEGIVGMRTQLGRQRAQGSKWTFVAYSMWEPASSPEIWRLWSVTKSKSLFAKYCQVAYRRIAGRERESGKRGIYEGQRSNTSNDSRQLCHYSIDITVLNLVFLVMSNENNYFPSRVKSNRMNYICVVMK